MVIDSEKLLVGGPLATHYGELCMRGLLCLMLDDSRGTSAQANVMCMK